MTQKLKMALHILRGKPLMYRIHFKTKEQVEFYDTKDMWVIDCVRTKGEME